MSKKETWEDLIEALDALNEKNNAAIVNKNLDSDYLPNDLNPFKQNNEDLNQYDSIGLHKLLKEISWDQIDIELEDDEPWEKLNICDQKNDEKDKENYNDCAEAFANYAVRISDDWGGSSSVFETCAWYQSYHYLPRTFWGIHILENCWISTAKKIYKYNPNTKTKNEAMKTAFLFYFCHELFHFVADNTATVLEIVKQNPNLYTDYSSQVYQKDYLNPGATEEALANRYLYGRYKFCRINKNFLHIILKAQPNGYRDFDKYLGNLFWEGRRILTNQILETKSSPTSLLPIEQVFEILDQEQYATGAKVPFWLHTKKGTKSRIFIKNK